jgi:hypothetical protein
VCQNSIPRVIQRQPPHPHNRGIQVLIGEDNKQPGRILDEKFMEMIRSSTIFLGILTDAAVSAIENVKKNKEN